MTLPKDWDKSKSNIESERHSPSNITQNRCFEINRFEFCVDPYLGGDYFTFLLHRYVILF